MSHYLRQPRKRALEGHASCVAARSSRGRGDLVEVEVEFDAQVQEPAILGTKGGHAPLEALEQVEADGLLQGRRCGMDQLVGDVLRIAADARAPDLILMPLRMACRT
jgi:hypothetical protein